MRGIYVKPLQIQTIRPHKQFNDTSRYLDDVFPVDNNELTEHISNIYPREIQLNKANTWVQETYFLGPRNVFLGFKSDLQLYSQQRFRQSL